MFKFFACTVLFWTVVPFLIPLLICLYVYRGFIIVLQKIVYPDWIGIMSPRDMVVWESMKNPHLQGTCYSIMILRGEVDLEKFQNDFMDRVISYRNPQGKFSYAKFTHYFEEWMGFPFWKKERQFDIKQHIRFLTDKKDEVKSSNKVETELMTEEQLYKISGDLLTRPFEFKTSPWEMLIVPKYGYRYQPKESKAPLDSEPNQGGKNNYFVLIFRHHHTLLDGYSYQKMFVERICGQNIPTLTLKKEPTSPTGILVSAQRFVKILLNLGMYHAQFFFLDKDVNVWHGNGQGNKKLMRTTHTVRCEGAPFSAIRSVSKKLGVAPTATMFSCVAGGIRRYLEMEQEDIPEKMAAFFPWPVKNHPMDGLVNHWSFVDMVLPLGETNRVRRVHKTNAHFQALKSSPLPEIIWNLSPFISAIPTPIFNVLGWNRKSTLNITNFPGSTVAVTLFGKWELVESTGFLNSLRGNTAVQFIISAIWGNVYVTITADRGVISEKGSKQRARCSEEEFKHLDQLC